MSTEYAALVKRIVAALPMTKTAIAQAIAGRTNLYRIETGDPKEELSYETLIEIIEGIRRLAPDAQLPPPVVRVRDQDDYDWIKMGRRYRHLFPSDFSRTLGVIRSKVDAAAAEAELGMSVNPDADPITDED